jgi:gamma-glutamylcyclotransferase (GGCT)/AIG2-like uncharacterized protein YtfP
MSLYFAYGSNTSKVQMHCRCPDAVPVGSLTLEDWTLVFRAVADIAPSPGDAVHGVVWKLSPSDEATLDQFEGVAKGSYRKVYIPIEPFEFGGDHHEDMLVYVMNSTGIMPPTISYLRTIRDGYRDFALPMAALDDAVERSHDDKAMSSGSAGCDLADRRWPRGPARSAPRRKPPPRRSASGRPRH